MADTERVKVRVGNDLVSEEGEETVVSGLPLTRDEVAELIQQQGASEGLDLSGRNLSFIDLSGLDLDGVILCGATLRSARLRGTSLEEADLSQTEMVGADLREANLTGADLKESDLRQANLDRARLGGANLEEADLSFASGVEAHLEGANLRRAKLTEANLQRAYLADADLVRADLTSTNLQGARLTEADLSQAELKGCYLQNAMCVRARFYEADLTGTHLAGTYLNGAQLTLATAFAADMAGAHIEFANWEDGYMLGDEKKRNFADAEATYRSFRRRYDELGMYDHAGEFFLREMTARRKALWWGPVGSHDLLDSLSPFRTLALLRALWPRHPLAWAASMLMNLLSGYGERPFRVVAWVAAIVLGMALVYYLTASIVPGSFLDAVYFSAASFTALGYGLWGGVAQPLARGLGAAEAFLGLFFMALFLVTFVRRMAR